MIQIVAIFFGGGLGSLARYGVSEMANLFFSNSLKVTIFATLLANILACLISVSYTHLTLPTNREV